jgi:hypothetical protein
VQHRNQSSCYFLREKYSKPRNTGNSSLTKESLHKSLQCTCHNHNQNNKSSSSNSSSSSSSNSGGSGDILWKVSNLNPQRGTGSNIRMDLGEIVCEDGR